VLVGAQPLEQPGPELREAGARISRLGLEADLVEAIGDPAEAICEVAQQNGADLIVVGTREPSLLERSLGHSVSEQVQRRAHCDVLIVH
jgi:nucleotide-binding universal stress UspA family protein